MSNSHAFAPRPLKVGYLLPHFHAGGIERIVLNLIRLLDERRYSSTLILRSRQGSMLPQLPARTAIVDLADAKMRGIPLRLAQCLARLKLDVVYSGTNAANLALLAAIRLMRSPPRAIVSEHTAIDLFFKEAKWPRVRRLAMRSLYTKADVVAVPLADLGEALRSSLRLPGLPIRELLNPLFDASRIANGIASDRRAPPPFPSPYFVAAGRLAKVKAYDILLAAFSEVVCSRNDIRLVFLGEGEERAALEAQTATLGLTGHVHFLGFVADPMAYFRDALGLVISSHREGTPNVIPEAMAAGTPVIATDCSVGPRRLLQEGAAGILVPPGQPVPLAQAMIRLACDAEEAARLRTAGFEQARKFTFQETLPQFEAVFRDVVQGRVSAASALRSRLV